jgi:DNA-binding FadR family transcriptional regulator
MFFRKIRDFGGRKKSSLAAEQILEAISRGVFKEGDRLPAERKIAEEMGTSRPPVREALSALQIVGVVESLAGDGTYVKGKVKNQLLRSKAIAVLEENESPFEALRARKAIESAIVELVISEVQQADLEIMHEIVAEMRSAIEAHDLDGYFESNKKFHLAIAGATHNSLFVKILEYLLGIADQPLWMEAVQRYFSDYHHIKAYFYEHQKILKAIETKDLHSAKALIRDHFDRTVKEVKDYL